MKYSLVIALLINSSEAAKIKNSFITDQLKEMAMSSPEVGVIQHKLERIEALKPRMQEAMGDISDITKPIPQTKEPSPPPPCVHCHTHYIHHTHHHHHHVVDNEIPRLAKKALDKLHNVPEKTDSIKDLANKALKNLGGMGGGNMAKEAAEGDASVEHLAGKALEAMKESPKEEAESVEDIASRALKQMDSYKSESNGDSDVSTLAKKALGNLESK
jgi:hypothetical protein